MLGMEAALRTTTVACKEGHSTRKSPRGKVPATQPYHEGFANRNDLPGSVPISYASAPEPVFARGKARGAKFGRSKYATRNAASRKNRPGPKGCAANVAMRRCGTWQGSDHCLRPAPCGTPPGLATFVAATRSATKREQTLAGRFLRFQQHLRHAPVLDFDHAQLPAGVFDLVADDRQAVQLAHHQPREGLVIVRGLGVEAQLVA